MRRDVLFECEDGTALRGFLHASAGSPIGGIVMAHGLSGVKEQIDHYAAFFAAHGLAVLVYDHRAFGASSGEPRWELDPARQIADWRDAITFARGQPEFDALAEVGVWGSSFAGGLAMVVAASDCRVGCVVAQIPHVSGHRNARQTFDVTDRARLRQAMTEDRVARLSGGDPAMVPVFGTEEGELCALPPSVGSRYLQAVKAAAPSWSNEITLRSLENAMQFEPAGWVPYVSPTPLLMIVATNDSCIAQSFSSRSTNQHVSRKRWFYISAATSTPTPSTSLRPAEPRSTGSPPICNEVPAPDRTAVSHRCVAASRSVHD